MYVVRAILVMAILLPAGLVFQGPAEAILPNQVRPPADLGWGKETNTRRIPGGNRQVQFDALKIITGRGERSQGSQMAAYLEPSYLPDRTGSSAHEALAAIRGGGFSSADRLISIAQNSVKPEKPPVRLTRYGAWQVQHVTFRIRSMLIRSLALVQELPPDPNSGFRAVVYVEPNFLKKDNKKRGSAIQMRFVMIPPAKVGKLGDVKSLALVTVGIPKNGIPKDTQRRVTTFAQRISRNHFWMWFLSGPSTLAQVEEREENQ